MFAICDGKSSLIEAKTFAAGFIPSENFILVPNITCLDTEDSEDEKKEQCTPDLHELMSGILLKKFKEEVVDESELGEVNDSSGGACCNIM